MHSVSEQRGGARRNVSQHIFTRCVHDNWMLHFDLENALLSPSLFPPSSPSPARRRVVSPKLIFWVMKITLAHTTAHASSISRLCFSCTSTAGTHSYFTHLIEHNPTTTARRRTTSFCVRLVDLLWPRPSQHATCARNRTRHWARSSRSWRRLKDARPSHWLALLDTLDLIVYC